MLGTFCYFWRLLGTFMYFWVFLSTFEEEKNHSFDWNLSLLYWIVQLDFHILLKEFGTDCLGLVWLNLALKAEGEGEGAG